MITHIEKLAAGQAAIVRDSGSLILQGFYSPAGTGSVVVNSQVDGVTVLSSTKTITSSNVSYIDSGEYEFQEYSFNTTGMTDEVYAIFTSMRL